MYVILRNTTNKRYQMQMRLPAAEKAVRKVLMRRKEVYSGASDLRGWWTPALKTISTSLDTLVTYKKG